MLGSNPGQSERQLLIFEQVSSKANKEKDRAEQGHGVETDANP